MFRCIRKITVHPLFFFCLAWIIFTDSAVALFCVIASVFLHECGHIFVYSKAHVAIDEIHLQPFGVRITTRNEALIGPRTQFVCALAGPTINLLCTAIYYFISKVIVMPEWTLMFYLSSLFLGLFNLLPIMPLDGSRMLGVALSVVFGEYISQMVCAWVSMIMGLCTLVAGIYVLIMSGMNVSLCILAGYILICLAMKIYNLLKKRISNVEPKT